MKLNKLGTVVALAATILIFVGAGFTLARTEPQVSPYPSYGSAQFFFPPYPSENERMGIGRTSNHDTSNLNAGWYFDWAARANPTHFGGAEYARVIMFKVNTDGGPSCTEPATDLSHVTPNLTGTTLIQAVNNDPGALWLVGNEPDSIFNKSPIQAELYAELYHHFYTTIKEADPTAKVAIGAIIQPSPVRLLYLDKVLNHYQSKYGQALPTDLWNIHFYILNEAPDCQGSGAGGPPFTTGPFWNIPFEPENMLDLAAMEANLRTFRQWMYDRGYGDMPLIITEFGVLMPPTFAGFENEVAAKFLEDIFPIFLSATDPTTGYEADGDRLVQMWAWFSTWYGEFGGDLYANANDSDLTVIGDAFIAQTNAHVTPYVDIQVEPPKSSDVPGTLGVGTISAGAFVTNRGNITATDIEVTLTAIDYFSQSIIDTSTKNIASLQSRYAQPPVYVDDEWMLEPPFAFTLTISAKQNQTLIDPYALNDSLDQLIAWHPNLSVTDIHIAPIFFDENTTDVTTPISVTVTNTGLWTSTLTTMQIQVFETLNAVPNVDVTINVPGLGYNESVELTVPWTIEAAGGYTISAQVLPDIDLLTEDNLRSIKKVVPKYYLYLPLLIRN